MSDTSTKGPLAMTTDREAKMAGDVKLTESQLRNLRHVEEFGQPLPRNSAAYHCRRKGLTEFIWSYSDGETATVADKPPMEGAWLEKVVGERLTDAGRAALRSQP